MACRVCGTPLHEIISFGPMPIANGFLEHAADDQEYFFPLTASFCDTCKMLQLKEQPAPEKMFHQQYAFFSSTSQRMATHFQQMALSYQQTFLAHRENPFIVELGSNDGIMLQHFATLGIRHLGIEPSQNVAAIARRKGVQTLNAFFNEATATEIVKQQGQADIISAANVMCHIPDIHEIGRAVKRLLRPDGVFVFEDPYLGDMIKNTSYDQLYDEHVYLYSLHSISYAFAQHDLTVFDVAPQSTHGGSMRYYLCHTDQHEICSTVPALREQEQRRGLIDLVTYQTFAQQCARQKHALIQLLQDLKKAGKRVVGYAATSKSTTVLNYCGIGPDLLEYICDTTPIKQNKVSPGMHIPIRPYEYFQHDTPDYAVLFAWNHREEIFLKDRAFIERGGQWIVFVPDVEIISSSDLYQTGRAS